MSYDTIIVGGGITGLGIGWRAGRLGLRVLVLERDDRPSGASAVAAGMLAPVTEATFGEEALLALNLASARLWPGFLKDLAADSGMQPSLLPGGTLHLAMDGDQAAQVQRLYEYQHGLGLQVQRLSSSACREIEPALHPWTRAGILAPGDRAVDPRLITRALTPALKAAGGSIRSGVAVEAVHTGDSPGVTLADGTDLSAKSVVLAAGCWSGQIDGVPAEVASALRPVKGQILRLRHLPGQPRLFTHVLRTEEVYMVPRADGEVIVGASVEEKGFDTTPTAGAVLELLRSAERVVPGIRELELAEVNVGLRPGSRDNAPVLGAAAPGLIVATGHYRNGILLAPITAEGTASLLAKEELPPEFKPFQPGRFAQ